MYHWFKTGQYRKRQSYLKALFYASICKIYTLSFQISYKSNLHTLMQNILKTYRKTQNENNKIHLSFQSLETKCYCFSIYVGFLFAVFQLSASDSNFLHIRIINYLLLFYIFLCDIIILLMLCSYSRSVQGNLSLILLPFMMFLLNIIFHRK